MTVSPGERGAALLTVLLLVAVMATIAATAIDRIGVGTRLVVNVASAGQARAWLNMAEVLAATRVEDLAAADGAGIGGSGWLGAEKSIALPDGAVVTATVRDGGNCFNLNSLVQLRPDGTSVARAAGAKQFGTLMAVLGIDRAAATRIVATTTDYLDSDSMPLPAGGEDSSRGGKGLSANRLMADRSELRVVGGVSTGNYKLLERWVCALPTSDLSPINVNSLLPDQAPLLAMLVPGQADLARAKVQIAARPAGGYSDAGAFWKSGPFAAVEPDSDAMQQVRVKTSFFDLRARVASGELEFGESVLIDARSKPARVVRRKWGETD